MLLRLYLALVGWAFVGGAVLQLLLTRYTGTRSVWGISPGWQREIGLWNVAMLVVVNRAVRSDVRVQRDVALALVCLTILLGTNHLWALVTDGVAQINLTGVILNYLGAILGLFAIRSAR